MSQAAPPDPVRVAAALAAQGGQCADCVQTNISNDRSSSISNANSNNTSSVTWADAAWGRLLCIRCAGVHRSLPNSRVLSCTLDNWNDRAIEAVFVKGPAGFPLPPRPQKENGEEDLAESFVVEADTPSAVRSAVIRARYLGERVVWPKGFNPESYLSLRTTNGTDSNSSGSSKSVQVTGDHGDRTEGHRQKIRTRLHDLAHHHRLGSASSSSASRHSSSVDRANRQGEVLQAAAQRYTGVLAFVLVNGRDLESKDLNGFSDPYVVVQLGDQKRKSATKKKTLNPDWNESIMLHCRPDDEITITVWDADFVSRDDKIDRVVLSLGDYPLGDGQIHAVNVPLKHGSLSLTLQYTSLEH